MALADEFERLLRAVESGERSADDALDELRMLASPDLGFSRPDTLREMRQGAPEAVLAEGKTSAEVVAIVDALLNGEAGSVLVTRADTGTRKAVRAAFEDTREHERAAAVWIERAARPRRGSVALLSAGTSDGHALHEARIRAELLGANTSVHEDVGVAGLHRLFDAMPVVRDSDAVVVCAGMDGALVSVVGGLASVPVIGVPTSAGYGSAHNGTTARDAMLSSCAAGVVVVGIDDGFGAGTVAALIARRSHRDGLGARPGIG